MILAGAKNQFTYAFSSIQKATIVRDVGEGKQRETSTPCLSFESRGSKIPFFEMQ